MAPKTTGQPDLAPAFIIAGVSPAFPPALMAATKELVEVTKAVARARAGAESLNLMAAQLQRRVDAMRAEIANADGSAAAAAAMGLAQSAMGMETGPAKTSSDHDAQLASKTAELAAVEKQLEATIRAQASAPALFDNARAPLGRAIAKFRTEYAAAADDLIAWAQHASLTLESAEKAVDHFHAAIDTLGQVAAQTRLEPYPDGHPLALFPQLAEFHLALSSATSVNRPLSSAPSIKAPVHEHPGVKLSRVDPNWRPSSEPAARPSPLARLSYGTPFDD